MVAAETADHHVAVASGLNVIVARATQEKIRAGAPLEMIIAITAKHPSLGRHLIVRFDMVIAIQSIDHNATEGTAKRRFKTYSFSIDVNIECFRILPLDFD